MMKRILAATMVLSSCDAGSTSTNPDQHADASGGAPAPDDTTQAEELGVLETIEKMTSAFNRGDLDAVMTTYEDPATVVFEPGKPATTTQQIRAGFEQFVAMKPHFEFSGHEVYIAADIAVHHTPWTMTATAPDGTGLEQRGLSVAVLRRQEGGEWLMAIDNPYGQFLLDTAGYPGNSGGAPNAATEDERERRILATIDKMTSSFHAGDIDGVISTYAPSAIVMFEPGRAVEGLTNIRAAFEQSIQMKPHFEFGGHEVYISGDLAVHHNPWTMTATAPDGSTVQQHGLSIAVLQRQPDGQWLMVIDNPHGQRLVDTVGYP